MTEIKKMALITGGTKGLGKRLAYELACFNYDIWAIYKNDDLSAKSCAKEFDKQGFFFQYIKHDLDSDHILDINFLKQYDKIILIHNACSRFNPGQFHKTDLNEFRKQMETSFFSTVKLIQHLIRPLSRNSSQVVFILSHALKENVKGLSHYIIAKKALETLSECLSLEYKNIKFNCFYPNFMQTTLTSDWEKHYAAFYAKDKQDPKENAKLYVQLLLNLKNENG
jgi:3-oxoacyl-[acyl-carrier protein] reductase